MLYCHSVLDKEVLCFLGYLLKHKKPFADLNIVEKVSEVKSTFPIDKGCCYAAQITSGKQFLRMADINKIRIFNLILFEVWVTYSK